ncbi:MAG: 1-acyl-sn-glycerol-3-phosphate acyltransferase [Candidatus Thermoplasmatota archaeon]|nr:1-acyl-sn-glycerol-3-phosphate acyltransferase [Candidatus Thermoplasmatota archaeon]
MAWLYYIVYPAVSFYFRMAFRIWKIPGREKIPKGGKIYAANHCSNAEGPILNLIHYMRPVRFLGKSELFENPVKNVIMRGVGTIPLKRGGSDSAALENAVKALKKGQFIGIFPEGTRGNGKDLRSPHTGVIRLALMADVPIVPVGISGAIRSWPRNRIIPKFGKKVWLTIGEPWYVPKPPPGHEYTYEELKGLANELMYERIGRLIDRSKNE